MKLHEARLELELQKEMGRKDEMQIRNQSDEAIKKMKLLYAEEAEYLKE